MFSYSNLLAILFATLTFFGLNNSTIAQSAEYLWPTEASPYLTSTFGETRSAHFHAGLDIKTWGREGYEVYATRGGKLHRLAIGPVGYGKVVYLEHKDGSFSLYAHLQRFAPRLQKIADSIRIKDYSFEMDTVFNEQSIPIEKGEIVGYSGSTGVGPPHLHFELRDNRNRPFNALETGLNVRDGLPPVFSELLVEPLKPGQHPTLKKPTAVDNNEDTTSYNFGVLEVNGPVGFALDVYDEVRDVTNKYAAYELLMIHENDTLFHSRLDYFSYEMDEQMFIDRTTAPGSTKRRFQRLYIKDGNTLPFYKKAEKAIQIPSRTGNFTFLAKDYFGNTSKAIVRVKKQSKQRINDRQNDAKCLASADKSCYWTENWISTPNNMSINLTSLENYPQLFATHFTGNTKKQHLAGSDYSHKILRLYPSDALRATINQNTSVFFPKNIVFDTLSVSVTANDFGITLLPESTSFRSAYIITYYLKKPEAPAKKYGFYEHNGEDNEYEYIESDVKGNTLWGFPKKAGFFTVKADTLSPVANNPVIRKIGPLNVISLTATDNLSGIDYINSSFFVNGQQGILEFEPEDDRITFYHPDFELQDTNVIELYLFDKAGNKNTLKFKIKP